MIATHCSSFVWAMSDLRGGDLDVEGLEVSAALELASQAAAVRVARRCCALQHLVLVVLDRLESVGVGDVDVAGGAHRLTAALPDDPGDVVLQSRSHDRYAIVDVDDPLGPIREAVGDLWHGFSSEPR